MPKSKGIRKPKRLKTAPKNCYFCDENKLPSFKNAGDLGKFTTERGKIISRARTGVCSIHQNDLAKNIKYARHLAIMPFVAS